MISETITALVVGTGVSPKRYWRRTGNFVNRPTPGESGEVLGDSLLLATRFSL